mmetsp:Transcript_58611/g.154000  ORF Transcript_58611/g.154000 Transcript_58611/m.154000 type:complete len:374 (-) Transcript_58611:1671-2792(-)
MRRWTPVVVSSETPTMRATMSEKRFGSLPMDPLMVASTHLNSALSVVDGSGSDLSLAYCSSNFLPSCSSSVASPPSSTIWSQPLPSGHMRALSVHHQYSSSVSPFQAKMFAEPLRTHAAAAWSCVEKMLHEHQRTSAPRACSVSASTAVWMVMCSEPITRIPASGCAGPNSARADMRPGISYSARSSSLRPNSASDMSATLKSPDASTALSGGSLASSAAMPGSSLPSSSSSDAPPPVETCVTLSSVSYFLQQVAVSPPPITVTTPALVTSTMVSIIDLVPDSKEAISKTPIGPFQMIVLEALMAAAFSSIVLGPQSRPIMPALTPLSSVAVSIVPSSPNLDDVTKSTGSTSSTPLALAFSTICGTILAPSSS